MYHEKDMHDQNSPNQITKKYINAHRSLFSCILIIILAWWPERNLLQAISSPLVCLLQSIAIADIGTFLQGVAAMTAVVLGRSAFEDYWKQRRSAAAAIALSSFRLCIANINDIIKNKTLCQYVGYYPGLYPEIDVKDLTPYPQRPGRLVYNQVGELKKKLYKTLSPITGNQAVEISKLIDELDIYSRKIQTSLWIKVGPQSDSQSLKNIHGEPEQYIPNLNDILQRAEKILAPLIKG
jgi:hypothetical protein